MTLSSPESSEASSRPAQTMFQALRQDKSSAALIIASGILSVACALHGKEGPAVVAFMSGAYLLKGVIDRARMNAVIGALKDISGDMKRVSLKEPE